MHSIIHENNLRKRENNQETVYNFFIVKNKKIATVQNLNKILVDSNQSNTIHRLKLKV